jgi:hypothetical protein
MECAGCIAGRVGFESPDPGDHLERLAFMAAVVEEAVSHAA